MPTYRDRAVVLRAYKLGEADRIVTLLTQYNGKVRAVARGVRRTSSKFGGRLEPFSHVDVQLVRGRTLDVIAQVDTVAGYSKPLRDDYPRFTAGEVMLETADRLIPEEGEPALTQYHLLVGALHALGGSTTLADPATSRRMTGEGDALALRASAPDGGDGPTRTATMILDSYLLRALASAGYKMALTECARCGQVTPQRWFSVTAGGLVCAACKPSGASPLDEATWSLLGALLAGDWATAAAATPDAEARAHTTVEAFTTWHLEHALRSLPLLDVG